MICLVYWFKYRLILKEVVFLYWATIKVSNYFVMFTRLWTAKLMYVKTCLSPSLERADFDRQSFSIYLVEQLILQFASTTFKSFAHRCHHCTSCSCDIVRSLLQLFKFKISGTLPCLGHQSFCVRVKYHYPYKRQCLSRRTVTDLVPVTRTLLQGSLRSRITS